MYNIEKWRGEDLRTLRTFNFHDDDDDDDMMELLVLLNCAVAYSYERRL